MVIYFTGTGNSRYLAGLIASRLEDKVVSMNDRIKLGIKDDVLSEKALVIVSPTYCYHLPKTVTDYLESVKISAPKIYFIMTCGAGIGGAGAYNAKIAETKNIPYGGTKAVVMPDNYIAMYEASSYDVAQSILDGIPATADEISEAIKAGESFSMKKSGLSAGISKLGAKVFNGMMINTAKFAADDNCTGCGSCANICPMNNISIENRKPKWGDSCVHCIACMSFCPRNAIQYGKKTENRRRYYLFPDGTQKKP